MVMWRDEEANPDHRAWVFRLTERIRLAETTARMSTDHETRVLFMMAVIMDRMALSHHSSENWNDTVVLVYDMINAKILEIVYARLSVLQTHITDVESILDSQHPSMGGLGL